MSTLNWISMTNVVGDPNNTLRQFKSIEWSSWSVLYGSTHVRYSRFKAYCYMSLPHLWSLLNNDRERSLTCLNGFNVWTIQKWDSRFQTIRQCLEICLLLEFLFHLYSYWNFDSLQKHDRKYNNNNILVLVLWFACILRNMLIELKHFKVELCIQLRLFPMNENILLHLILLCS